MEKVWLSDPHEGFVLGKIVDLTDEGASVQRLNGPKKEESVSFDHLYPAQTDDSKDFDDNCGLMHLNEATLLNNIKLRYERDKIYTYVANILIAINPYYEIPKLYAPQTIAAYKGRSLGTTPPHVYAIADKAFRDMKVLRQSQSIIVSGESGAGKTESTKYILKYLCDNYGRAAGSLEQKILNANPILEAFGNAKTMRNNNSSRFGKFIEIHFDAQCQVAGGYISHYLLERARVVSQTSEERNYHIFYQLCAGAPEKLRQQLHLGPPNTFHYLSKGCTRYFCSKENDALIQPNQKSKDHLSKGPISDPLIDDVRNFKIVEQGLQNLGMTDQERMSVYMTIAAVLHLGNIDFEDDPDDNRGGCRVKDYCENSLTFTAGLIGLDPDEMRRALTARMMQANKSGFKGTVILVPLKTHEACNARDALAKTIYSRLFDYIVMRINKSIPFSKTAYYIGILDIAGFEYFTSNSFEQFCINYCNEKLQQFFNQRILKEEQELYEKEGLGVKKISFIDNQDCIDLIESKGSGIFSLLDEESKLPKPSHQNFTQAVHGHNNSHIRLAFPRKSKLKDHREIRDDDGFLIRHFAGAVCYETAHFIEKNNDALHDSLEALAQECSNKFINGLFNQKENSNSTSQKGKLTFVSVGNKFKRQLEELMEKLRSTGTNFIRCIKPNVRMVAHKFEGGSILSQLQCAGMTSVLELMQQGFPSRTQFSDLYTMYKKFLPAELARLDPRLFCKALFKALGLNDKDFKFGLTKVFFRPGKFAEFDQIIKSDPENLAQLVRKVKTWLLCSRWKKAQWCALSVVKLKNKILYRRDALITVQKTVKMHLVKSKHQPRYKGIMALKKLKHQIESVSKTSAGLKNDKDVVAGNISKIDAQLEASIKKIKQNPNIKKGEIDTLRKSIVNQIDGVLADIRVRLEKQRAREEQERLRKIQEEMEREKRKKEEEEKAAKENEKKIKVMQEMEIRRKKEEEKTLRHQEANRMASAKIQAELEAETIRSRERDELERRDHELALRLAAESNSSIDDFPTPLKRSSAIAQQMLILGGKKYDLSKFKYAELRDTINTSCDIELLEACKEEFHRRLKVYHQWKSLNRNSAQDENMRAPPSVLKEAEKSTQNRGEKSVAQEKGNRFFKVKFPGKNDEGVVGNGWWYAHFENGWVVRQMEIVGGQKAILKHSGKDDMTMFERPLSESGLATKRGAEITQDEFEAGWAEHGGKPWKK